MLFDEMLFRGLDKMKQCIAFAGAPIRHLEQTCLLAELVDEDLVCVHFYQKV